MPDENIKVAVRVRPFIPREESRNAKLVISMSGETTTIKDPNHKSEPKKFTFDHSYWSHDGFNERSDGYFEPSDSKYVDQKRVFNDLGLGILENAWKGYNCSLFAYGQTGSGKSYSVVGSPENKGIVPQVCENLFQQIADKVSGGADSEYQVTVSMLEIYCEKIYDLIAGGGSQLKMREHPKKGFYVEGLKTVPVNDQKSIDRKIKEGNKNRTIAATKMNETSSRAHTIFRVTFSQKTKGEGSKTKSSSINLVDLAGSERQEEAKTEGDRLKEGIVINKSLTTLGRVIKALVENQGKKGGQQVPYRDSVLTALLKNALGGNSKTVMIAALSPADINYEETVSTLRFADRAKEIKTKAVVNESKTDKLIRELKEENTRLQSMLANGGVAVAGSGDSNEEVEALRQQLEENKKEMEEMQNTWQQRLDNEAATGGKVAIITDHDRADKPHLWNLNEDPSLCDVIVHMVKNGTTNIGSEKGRGNEVVLSGMNIGRDHCRIKNDNDTKIKLIPSSGAKILVNGQQARGEVELFHNDRIHFGGNNLYVIAHPADLSAKTKKNKSFVKKVTYDLAQAEIAEKSGIISKGNRSKEDMILEEDLIRVLPLVAQANGMAEEMKKKVIFDIVLVAPQARGREEGHTEIFIKMICNTNGNEFLWNKNKFINRHYGMQEMYQNFLEDFASVAKVPKERDPFYESPDVEVLLGICHVYLQSLAYMVEISDQMPITDFKGNEHGHLNVSVIPCGSDGKEIIGQFVENPRDLIGKSLTLKVKIEQAKGISKRFISTKCRYRIYGESVDSATMEVSGPNPNFAYEKLFHFKPVNDDVLRYLEEQALIIHLFGKQSDKKVAETKLPSAPLVRKDSQTEAKLNKIEELLARARNGERDALTVGDLEEALGKSQSNGHAGGNKEKRHGSKSKGESEKRAPSKDKKKEGGSRGSSKRDDSRGRKR